MIDYLYDLLRQIRDASGPTFTGVGVIISDFPDELPIVPLRRTRPAHGKASEVLAAICHPESEYHDGFHVLSSRFELSRVAQYFSPPALPGLTIDYSKHFGGRYLAAQFGSAIPATRLTGIASLGFGIAVFKGGVERLYERSE